MGKGAGVMKNKQEYITIGLPKATLSILKKFLDEKGLTTKEGFSEVAEAYMIAKDEELFRKLHKEYYNVEKLKIEMKKNEAVMNDTKIVRETFICKLSDTETTNVTGNKSITGRQTIDIYIKNMNSNGKNYTYFSTKNLHQGMNEDKRREYLDRINSGDEVRMYFALNDAITDNDIAYSARVLDIISYKTVQKAPCEDDEYPIEFRGEEKTVWIKITDIRKETKEKAADYIVVKKGTILKESISTGQCAFAYIRKFKNI